MAWVRIDDQVPRHHKMLNAGPAACWLWVCGIAHCQSQLTNGFISEDVLPMIGVKGEPRCRRLAETLVTHRLFDRVPGGYQVHDYLASNDTREEALTKKAAVSDQRRQAGVASGERRRAERRQQDLNKPRTAPFNKDANTPLNPIPSHPIREEREKTRARVEPNEGEHPIAVFIRETYPTVYAKCRNGATFRVSEARDFEVCRDLVDTYGDRVGLLLEYFLQLPPAKDVLNQPGTPRQFAHMAPMCDSELRKHGR